MRYPLSLHSSEVFARWLKLMPGVETIGPQSVNHSGRHRLGKSMRDMREDIRMAAAHQRVQQTDLPLTEIAVVCGYASLAAFARTYRRSYDVPPSRDRLQSVVNTVFRPSLARPS